MSETPTPRMDLACDNLDDCLDWEQVAYRVAAQGQELERELTAKRAARERAEAELKENEAVINVWRGRTQRAEAERDALRTDAERLAWLERLFERKWDGTLGRPSS